MLTSQVFRDIVIRKKFTLYVVCKLSDNCEVLGTSFYHDTARKMIIDDVFTAEKFHVGKYIQNDLRKAIFEREYGKYYEQDSKNSFGLNDQLNWIDQYICLNILEAQGLVDMYEITENKETIDAYSHDDFDILNLRLVGIMYKIFETIIN